MAKDAENVIPDPETNEPSRKPTMLTSDLALRVDPVYDQIGRRFLEHPEEFADAFARAWYKLLHRDMGPITRYLGPWVPEPQIWQDPVPPVDHELVDADDVAALKRTLLDSGLTRQQLVNTAWAAAASYRHTDKRGGANGARIRFAPQRSWAVNASAELDTVLPVLERIQQEFSSGGKRISLADLIVLGGTAAVEEAARAGGVELTVPFSPGRTDATAGADRHRLLPGARAARRRLPQLGRARGEAAGREAAARPRLHALAHPAGDDGARGRHAGPGCHGAGRHGVLTDRPGVLTNDFFVNLLDMATEWKASAGAEENVYEGRDRATGEVRWTATAVDLVFGANSELRAQAEVYGGDDAGEKFVRDFVAAWTKVMELDRFDLHR